MMKLKLALTVLILQIIGLGIMAIGLARLSPSQITADIASVWVKPLEKQTLISGHDLTCSKETNKAVCGLNIGSNLLKVVVQYHDASKKSIKDCHATYQEKNINCTATFTYVGRNILPSVIIEDILDIKYLPTQNKTDYFMSNNWILWLVIPQLALVLNISLVLWLLFINKISAYTSINSFILLFASIIMLSCIKFITDIGLLYLGFVD